MLNLTVLDVFTSADKIVGFLFASCLLKHKTILAAFCRQWISGMSDEGRNIES